MQELNTNNNSLPVIVVGAGPVGLTAALYLQKFRIPFILLEEDAELSSAAKAGTLTPRSLEIFAQLGIIKDILSEGLKLDVVNFVERRQNRILMRMPLYELDQDTAFPFTVNLPQSDYERILLRHIENIENDDTERILFRHRVVSLEQKDDRCLVRAETPNGEHSFEASYILACDGGRSTIRRALGIRHEGKTYPEKFALIDIKADLDADSISRPNYLSYIFDPDEWLILVRQPEMWRVLWPVRPEAPKLDDDEVLRKLRLAVGEREIEILSMITYKVHHRVAQKWRDGRVFLLGDAAHLITPVGGLGVSTGVMDAQNLLWKLAWVLKGWASEELLDSYEVERRPIAESIASGLADRNREMMQLKNPLKRILRDAALLAMQRTRAHRWNIAYTRSLLATSYHCAQKTNITRRILQTILPNTSPDVLVGDRIPDGTLFDSMGHRRWLHELVDLNFLALTFDDVRNKPSIPPLAEQQPFLKHYLISPFDAPHDLGLRDQTLWDVGGALTRRFHARPGTTFLVRPDCHVAAIEPAEGRSVRTLYEEYVGTRPSPNTQSGLLKSADLPRRAQ